MIAVGIKQGDTTNWYRAHSLTRQPDGAMCVFGIDDQRTTYRIPARLFAGVASSEAVGISADMHPVTLDPKQWEAK